MFIKKTQTILSNTFLDIESVRWDLSKNHLYALDTGYNTIYRVSATTGAKTAVFTLPGNNYIDNFRFYDDNTILVSESTNNVLYQHNFITGATINLTPVSVLCLPMGISFVSNTLYIADFVLERKYNIATNTLSVIARGGLQPPNPSTEDVSFGIFNVYSNPTYLALSCNFDGRVQIRLTTTNAVVTQVSAGWPYGVAITNDNSILLVNDFGTGLFVWNGVQFQTGRNLYPTFPINDLTGMALASASNFVYVAGWSEGAIYKVNYLTGAYTTVITGLNLPEGIATHIVNGKEYIAVAEVGCQSISLVDVSQRTKVTVATRVPIGLQGPDTLPPPYTFTGVAVASNGDIYFTSDLNDALIKIPNLS